MKFAFQASTLRSLCSLRIVTEIRQKLISPKVIHISLPFKTTNNLTCSICKQTTAKKCLKHPFHSISPYSEPLENTKILIYTYSKPQPQPLSFSPVVVGFLSMIRDSFLSFYKSVLKVLTPSGKTDNYWRNKFELKKRQIHHATLHK